jgi:hypothetical protein
MERPQIMTVMMKMKISHLRISQGRIIGKRLSFGCFSFPCLVQPGIGYMYLSSMFKVRKSKMYYFFKRREILDRIGEDDEIVYLVG